MVFDPGPIRNNACSFVLAADRCAEKRDLPGGQVQWLVVPEVVCRAFGTELYLKSIIGLEAIGASLPREHNLSGLFNQLSPGSKEALANALTFPLNELENKIANISETFRDWRYIHEVTTKTSIDDGEFLRAFAREVANLSDSLTNPSPNTEAD